MKKVILTFGFLALIGVLGFTGYRFIEYKSVSSAQLVEYYDSLEALSKSSPIVISGTLTGSTENFVYKDVTFNKSSITINKLLRGDESLSEGDTITLLQTDILEDPVVEEGKEQILFLKKYSGPVLENAYLIVGLKQGHFTLDSDGTVYPIAATMKKSSNNKTGQHDSQSIGVEAETSSGFSLKELEDILEKASYIPPK